MHEYDWFYRVYDRQTPAETFGAFAPVISLWQSRVSEGRIPEWTEFDFDDFAGWYGHISLGEIQPDFSQMVFRLWGAELTEIWAKDYTGLSMIDDTLPNHWEEVERPYVEALVQKAGIGVCGGSLYVFDHDFINVTYVDLPVTRVGKSPYLMSFYLRDADRTRLDFETPEYSFIEPYEKPSRWRDA